VNNDRAHRRPSRDRGAVLGDVCSPHLIETLRNDVTLRIDGTAVRNLTINPASQRGPGRWHFGGGAGCNMGTVGVAYIVL